jgi:hypothetical protein
MPYQFGQPWRPVWQDSPVAQLMATQAKPQTLQAPKQTLSQKVQGGVSGKLAPWLGKRMADKVAALADFTPAAGITQGYDAGTDIREGNYAKGAIGAAGAALSAMPDGGAALAKGAGLLHSIIAPLWHGSPHAFEKFALDKIGTGEGAQAYGHGLYFAENRKVAEDYKNSLTTGRLSVMQRNLDAFGGDHDRAIAALQNDIERLRNLPNAGNDPARRDSFIQIKQGAIDELRNLKATGKLNS